MLGYYAMKYYKANKIVVKYFIIHWHEKISAT